MCPWFHCGIVANWLHRLSRMRSLVAWVQAMGLFVALATASAHVVASPSSDPLIVPGATLTVNVHDEPTVSGTYLVDPGGDIHFSLADEEGGHRVSWKVHVAGLPAPQAQAAVDESLKTFFVMPEVSLRIRKLPGVSVEVTGAARHVGSLDLGAAPRLSDALTAAAPLPEADLSGIRLTRRASGRNIHTLVRTIDYSAFVAGQDDEDIALEPGDQIRIPLRDRAQGAGDMKAARVVGEVAREATVPLSTGMKMSALLDRCGGLKDTADRKSVRLVRGTDGRILELDADRIAAHDPLYDLPVGPGDLVIVGRRGPDNKFAVLGEVAAPNSFNVDAREPITLLKALEMAGGVTKSADVHHGLLRKGFLQTPEASRDIVFDLDRVVKNKEPDWPIETGDVVMLVPRAKRPSMLQQALPFLLRFLPFAL